MDQEADQGVRNKRGQSAQEILHTVEPALDGIVPARVAVVRAEHAPDIPPQAAASCRRGAAISTTALATRSIVVTNLLTLIVALGISSHRG